MSQVKGYPKRAAKKDELEMVLRTRKPSDKMVLQELMKRLSVTKCLSLTELIRSAEAKGIHFLFNQASTGKISGITYFYKDFKIKGQALGNRFKWAELIKTIDYEQIRDSKAVSEANSRTRAIFGELQFTGDERRNRTDQLYSGGTGGVTPGSGKQAIDTGIKETASPDRVKSMETGQDAGLLLPDSADPLHHYHSTFTIEISDDENDEKRRRRRRYSGR